MKLCIVCFFTNSGPVVIDPFSPKTYSYCLLVCFVLYPENLAWQSWGSGLKMIGRQKWGSHFIFCSSGPVRVASFQRNCLSLSFLCLPLGEAVDLAGAFYTFSGDSYRIKVLLKCKSTCLKHSQAQQYQNVRVWSRERFYWEPTKEMGSTCLKNPRLPKSSRQCPFLGMVREGCGELLQTSWFQSLCSSVRSWSGKHVPINLYQISIFLHLIRKNKFPRLNQTLRDPSPAERRQSSVCGSLRAGSPEILSNCHPWSSQASRSQLALRFLRLPWQRYPRPHRLHLQPLSHGDGGKQERVIASSRPEPGLTEDTALSPVLWTHRLAQGWRAGGRRPGPTSYLILFPKTTFPLAVGCIAH